MRNFKRFLALALSIVILCGMVTMSANAATTAGDYTEAANHLAAVGILKGDQSGNLMLNNEVKRWHTALFFMQIMTGITDAASLNSVKESTVFTDVPEYGTAIDQAYGFGVVRGRGNGIYGYNDNIIYQDMLVMAVRALGYETAEMNYPYGHILAAEKLGLTNNMAPDLQYTDALTRGETAQIMWNTLTTEIAYVDPVSDKVIYPGEQIPTASIFDKTITRETYLERSKFSQGTLDGTIVKFNASDPDTVTVEYYYTDSSDVKHGPFKIEINTRDLGITTYTEKASFLGLPITLYTDCDAADFASDYDIDAEQSEAKIVLTEFTEFTNVQNLADAGHIKYYPVTAKNEHDYFVIDGQKYASNKYTFDTRIFTEDGWVDDEGLMKENFLYDSKNGYIGNNSYGEINYTVITEEIGDDTVDTLLVLYMPYSFGTFGMRSLTYQPVSSTLDFVTIGTYEKSPGEYKNLDGVYTNFVEYTLGKGAVKIDKSSSSVSEVEGEASLNVIITGEEVATGDFIFYYYNEVDNILTIGLTCGTMGYSRLTSFGASKETVKIGGTNYDFGFPGAFVSNMPTFEEIDFENDYIDALKAGKDNVSYAVVGKNVVFVAPPIEDIEVNHSYLIISTYPERMADLLGMSVSAYEKKLTEISIGGNNYELYVDDGLVKVAVLDTASGEWYLSAITDIDIGEYDMEEDEFASRENLAAHVAGYTAFEDYTKADAFAAALPTLFEGIVISRGASADGYAIASIENASVEYWDNTEGLAFSDVNTQTNLIKATNDSDVSKTRRTLKDNSVIVIIDKDGNVGVRKGIQSTANNAFSCGRVYTSTNNLIVMKLNEYTSSSLTYEGTQVFLSTADRKAMENGKTVYDWEKASSTIGEETYYIATKDSSLTLEKNDDDTYTVTIENLFDLKDFVKVASVNTTFENETDVTDLENAFAAGVALYKDNKGNITASDDSLDKVLAMAADLSSTTDEEFHRAFITAFDDEVSIASTLKKKDSEDTVKTTNTAEAIGSVDVVMATINLSSADEEDYDFGHMALKKDDTNAPKEYLKGVSSVKYDADTSYYYLYTVGNVGDTSSVTDPTSGKLNNYILSTIGDRLYVPSVEDDYFENAVEVEIELHACGQFNESDGTLTIYMLKLIKDYTAE